VVYYESVVALNGKKVITQ